MKFFTGLFKGLFAGLFAAILLWFLPGAVARTSPGELKVVVKPVTLANFQPGRTKYGKLIWKGGLSFSSTDPRFGGFSGLALSKDGNRFVAVSDRSWWLKGKLVFEKGHLANATSFSMAKLKPDTSRKSSSWRDSESLAPWNSRGIDGSLLVGFERRERILFYNFARYGFSAKPKRIRHPKAISSGPFNKELEAVGRFYSGPRKKWLIAVSEHNLDSKGNIRGWLWRGSRTISWSLERFEDYDVTDLAVLPDGKSFLTLERSFNLPNLPGFAIRKFTTDQLKQGAKVKGEVLFSGRQPFFALDNMEGIAVHKAKNGKLQLTIISDDNYRRTLQRTLMFRFEMK